METDQNLSAFIRAAQAERLRIYRNDKARAEIMRKKPLRSINFLK